MSTYERVFSSGLEMLPPIGDMLTKGSRIALKVKDKILLINPAEIMTVEAQGNYVLVRRRSGSDLLRESMAVAAEKLRAYGFLRIHRSVIVNAACVEEIVTLETGDPVVRVQGGMEFPVSRSYRKNLRGLAPLWIGTNGFSDAESRRKKIASGEWGVVSGEKRI